MAQIKLDYDVLFDTIDNILKLKTNGRKKTDV